MFLIPERLLRIAGLICGLGASAVWTSFLTLEIFRVIRLLIATRYEHGAHEANFLRGTW
jgi:hypothetical protein